MWLSLPRLRVCVLFILAFCSSHDLRLGMDGMLLALCDHGFERSGQCVVNNNNNNTKLDFTVDAGKEWLNPAREKNLGTHRRTKVDEKSCVTFLLCDPGWYVQPT